MNLTINVRSQDMIKNNKARMAVVTAVIIAAIRMIADDIHDFIYEHDGITFWREHLWGLPLCLARATAIGLTVQVARRNLNNEGLSKNLQWTDK